MIDEACASIGDSHGEQHALVTYWSQRFAVANARGVAKMIKARSRSAPATITPPAPPLWPSPGCRAPLAATLPRARRHVPALQRPSACRRMRSGVAPPSPPINPWTHGLAASPRVISDDKNLVRFLSYTDTPTANTLANSEMMGPLPHPAVQVGKPPSESRLFDPIFN